MTGPRKRPVWQEAYEAQMDVWKFLRSKQGEQYRALLYREATDLPVDAARNFGIVNAAINRLHWDGRRFSLLQWADATHLEAAGLDEIDRSHPAA